MKTRLLLLALLFAGITYAQVPTDFVKKYSFTNGATNNEANGNYNLITDVTYGVPTFALDRFGNANSATDLNNGHYNMGEMPDRTGYDGNQFSLSFWMNSTDEGILFHQFDNSQVRGWLIGVFNNSINFGEGRYCTGMFSCDSQSLNLAVVPSNLLDGNWHHIVAIIAKENDGTNQSLIRQMYIDNVLVLDEVLTTIPFGGSNDIFLLGPANTQNAITGNTTGNDRYDGVLDDIFYYERKLNASEVNELFNDGTIVNIPDANFKAALVGNTAINTNGDAEIALSEATAYTGGILVPNLNISTLVGVEAFINITDIDASSNNLDIANFDSNTALTSIDVSNNPLTRLSLQNGNNTNITFFNALNNPNLFCIAVDDVAYSTANFPNVDSQASFSQVCASQIYVNSSATGTGNGASWANAYTSLKTAINDFPGGEFWIAAGTYTPGASRAEKLFLTDGQKLYGGFNGTESLLSDRDPFTNVTIISGDLMGNDSGPISVSNTTRSDNSYRLIEVSGDDVVIDGITLSGGQADGTVSTENGFAAVIKFVNGAGTFFMVNCIVRDNVSIGLSNIRNVDVSTSTNINFLQTQFFSNVASRDVIYYSRAANPQVVNTNMESCLFYFNETTASNESGLIWIRQDPSGNQNFIFNNCTVADNEFAHAGPVIDASRINGTISARIYNSIFWDNVTASTNNIVLGNGQWSAANLRQVRNCIDPLGFTNVPDRGSIVTTNPLFENATLGNYRLQTASPAKDTGDNQFVTSAMPTDLDGNMRIFNGTVDMGAYEFGSTLGIENFQNKITQFKIYPNPVNEVLNISIEGKIKNIEVYNMLGSRILVSTNNSINVSAFQNGIYIIKVTNMFNQQITKRFIKQ